MRTAMAAALSLLLLAPAGPGSAASTATQLQAEDEELQLLVPVEAIAEFEASLSPELAAEMQALAPPERVWLEGREYAVVAMPASRLEELYRETGHKAFHDELKVAMQTDEADVFHVADLAELEVALGIRPNPPARTV
jgi:hypothetical protein